MKLWNPRQRIHIGDSNSLFGLSINFDRSMTYKIKEMTVAVGKIITVISLLVFSGSTCAIDFDNGFSGSIIGNRSTLPKGYAVDSGIWRDDQGKAIGKPVVNFANKYWVGLHSCGAECRYYSMLDLDEGTESRALDMFSTTEPPSRTRDGHLYVTTLLTSANSDRLVAQYHVTLNQSGKEECRERMFNLKKGALIPLGRTKIGCNAKHSAGQ